MANGQCSSIQCCLALYKKWHWAGGALLRLNKRSGKYKCRLLWPTVRGRALLSSPRTALNREGVKESCLRGVNCRGKWMTSPKSSCRPATGAVQQASLEANNSTGKQYQFHRLQFHNSQDGRTRHARRRCACLVVSG